MALGADHAGDRGSLIRRKDGWEKRGLTSILQTGNHNPASTACGEEEACFDNGEDGKTICAFEDRARDDLIGEGEPSRSSCGNRTNAIKAIVSAIDKALD
jgi:hypothetical protein